MSFSRSVSNNLVLIIPVKCQYRDMADGLIDNYITTDHQSSRQYHCLSNTCTWASSQFEDCLFLYGYSYYKGDPVARPSYHFNGNLNTGGTENLY